MKFITGKFIESPKWDSECELLSLCIRMTAGSIGSDLGNPRKGSSGFL